MSLNGLDDLAVQEAYQAAIAEAGGWFLLKYASRDSVELFGRGKNGVHEARNAIAKYEEQSPLYGLIIYRRRKVLIKFIPEGTSRLLQARTAVHFQDVAERYSPYETLLEISLPDGLNDTSLASSFPLHTASPSASSSRLHEISEDGEDPGSMPRPIRTQSSTGSIFGTRQYKLERRVDQLMRSERPKPPSIHVSSESAPTMSSALSGAGKASISQFLVREDSGTRSITSLTSPSAASFSEYAGSSAESDTSTAKETDTISSMAELPKAAEEATDDVATPSIDEPAVLATASSSAESPAAQPAEPMERLSSLTSERSVERPSLSDRPSISERSKPDYDEPFDFSYLDPKPKIKLGPRPVAAADRTKRPLAAGISALPAAYRTAARKQEQEQRRKSQGAISPPQAQPPPIIYTPPPIPEAADYNPRPLSCKSLPSQKNTAMTTDRMRLMKAVELRKRKLRKSNPQIQAPAVDSAAPKPPKLPEAPKEIVVETGSSTIVDEAVDEAVDENNSASSNKADSCIDLDRERQDINHQERTEPSIPAVQPVEEETPLETPQGMPLQDSADPEPEQSVSETQLMPNMPNIQTEEPQPESDATQAVVAENSPENSPEPYALEQSRSISSDISTITENQERPITEDELRPNSPPPSEDPEADRDTEGPAFSTSLEHLITNVPATLPSSSSHQPPSPPSVSGSDARAPSAGAEHAEDVTEVDSHENVSPAEVSFGQGNDIAKRRRGLVEPLHIDVDKSNLSEGEIGSDDELMEELQSATLHEAKPMAVSKSPGPGAQFFPGRTSNQSAVSTASQSEGSLKTINIVNGVSHTTSDSSREQSQQRSERAPSGSPEPSQQARLVRAGPPTSFTPAYERSDPLAGLRKNVSNGITQRIQALAEHSREPSPNAVRIPIRSTTPEAVLNTFAANERRLAMRSPRSRTSSYRGRRQVEHTNSTSTNIFQPQDNVPVWSISQDSANNRNSVSVKARIVRPQNAHSEQAEEGTALEPAALQESRLEISHMRGIPTPTSVSQAFLPPLPPTSRSDSGTTVSSAAAPRESSEYRTLYSAKRKSWGRKQAPPPTEEVPMPSFSQRPGSGAASPASLASVDEQAPAGNRTSRFFKRMSNIGNMAKRRSAAQSVSSFTSPTSTDPGVPYLGSNAAEPDRSDMRPAVVVGDLNVQFPDTLLWKRRSLSLTSTGYVSLTIPAATEAQRLAAPTRQFALADFKAPYAPDLDRQELPHSVCLEFASGDGGVLQVACEDAMGQRQVLRLLGGYWRSWAG